VRVGGETLLLRCDTVDREMVRFRLAAIANRHQRASDCDDGGRVDIVVSSSTVPSLALTWCGRQ